MNCVMCGCDPDPIVLVPIKQTDGSIESFSCLECALKAGVYCEKHNRPHSGFMGDDSTACLYCIEEEVQKTKGRAEEVYDLILGSLPFEEWIDLGEAMNGSSMITGDDEDISLLRFIVTRAHRLHVSLDDVLVKILEKKSASIILPGNWF